jgi:hypothetical protein
MASPRSVSRPCRRMVCPDLSRAVFYQYLFPFRFEKTASSESRELSPPSPSMFARTRIPHPARSWERQVWQALCPPHGSIQFELPVPGAATHDHASSAGPACGTFYSCLITERNFRAGILVKDSECPHVSQQSIEIDRQIWGKHRPSVSPEASGRVYS